MVFCTKFFEFSESGLDRVLFFIFSNWSFTLAFSIYIALQSMLPFWKRGIFLLPFGTLIWRFPFGISQNGHFLAVGTFGRVTYFLKFCNFLISSTFSFAFSGVVCFLDRLLYLVLWQGLMICLVTFLSSVYLSEFSRLWVIVSILEEVRYSAGFAFFFQVF